MTQFGTRRRGVPGARSAGGYLCGRSRPAPMRLALLAAGLLLAAASAAQTVPVTFRVQMAQQVALGAFDPAAQSVDVAGSFNDWGSPAMPLADPDGDLTYERTVAGFTAGQTIQFKFRLDGQWDGTEEFPNGGANREYVVGPDGNVITVWYNDVPPPTGPPAAAFDGPRRIVAGGLGQFRDRSAGEVTGWQWTFDGGTPETSTESAPVVRYAAAGTYGVTLVATGPEGADTLAVPDFVSVIERPSGETYWWNDAVFYEVFVRSFYDTNGDGRGDFDGLRERLDYLNDGDPETDTDLGVTALWLMPIHPSPSYHGYDVTDYRGVNPQYGSMESFRALLAAAHERGIRVVIDFVVNHSARAHPWFTGSSTGAGPYRDFYRWSATRPTYTGPQGQTVWHAGARGFYYGLFFGGMPDLNFDTPAVRDSMFAASDFWLEDVGVDGFRLDAVKYVDEDGPVLENTPETYAFWADFQARVEAARPDAFTVCEAWSTTAEVVPYVRDSGLNACFEFDLAGRILNAVRTGDAAPLASAAQQIYADYPFLQVATFLTNHDQNRVMEELSLDVPRAKAAAALLLTLPGIPFVYYGEEIGMLGRKPDEDIRRPMQWSDAPGAGFTTGTPWRAPNPNYADWNVEGQTDDPQSLLSAYRRFISARNASPALRRGEYHAGLASDPGVMAFLRTSSPADGAEAVLVAVHTGDAATTDVALDLPPGILIPGSYVAERLDAPGVTESITVGADGRVTGLALEAHGVRIWRIAGAVDTAPGPAPATRLALEAPAPNPTSGALHLTFVADGAAPVTLALYDALGRRVASVFDGADLAGGRHTATLDTSRLAAGVYVVRLSQGDRQAVRRVVVSR